jgi:hypothetical protein
MSIYLEWIAFVWVLWFLISCALFVIFDAIYRLREERADDYVERQVQRRIGDGDE